MILKAVRTHLGLLTGESIGCWGCISGMTLLVHSRKMNQDLMESVHRGGGDMTLRGGRNINMTLRWRGRDWVKKGFRGAFCQIW